MVAGHHDDPGYPGPPERADRARRFRADRVVEDEGAGQAIVGPHEDVGTPLHGAAPAQLARPRGEAPTAGADVASEVRGADLDLTAVDTAGEA